MIKLKETKGITLIALVITIIVLLILAGITITSLSGENGLLSRASDARDETSEVRGKELIAMEAMASLNGEGMLDYDLLNKNLLNIPGLQYNGRPLGNGNGIPTNNQSPIIVYYNGFFYIIYYNGKVEGKFNYNGNVKNKLKLNLAAENDDEKSPYVRYKGELYKVLYDVDSVYPWIEIVSLNPIKTVTLGYNDPEMPSDEELIEQGYGTTDFEKSRWSFNNAIVTLNKHAQEYLSDVADRARCVCSDPDNPLNETTDTFIATNAVTHVSYGWMETYGWDGKFKDKDHNYSWGHPEDPVKDWTQLQNLGIRNFSNTSISRNYWMGSRGAMGGNVGASLHIRSWLYNGSQGINNSTDNLCFISNDGSSTCNSPTCGFRPVIRLKSKVKIKKGGDGTKDNPYELTM